MDLNEHLTDEEINKLKGCRSEDEWNETCVYIKERRGGRYPRDWWEKILKSGLMHEIASSWEKELN
jgi:hypothetical protein